MKVTNTRIMKTLNEIYPLTVQSQKGSWYKFAEKHKVSPTIAFVMKNTDLIKVTGRGDKSEFVWNAFSPPNKGMADRLMAEYKLRNEFYYSRRKKREMNAIKEIVERPENESESMAQLTVDFENVSEAVKEHTIEAVKIQKKITWRVDKLFFGVKYHTKTITRTEI